MGILLLRIVFLVILLVLIYLILKIGITEFHGCLYIIYNNIVNLKKDKDYYFFKNTLLNYY